MRLVLGYVSAVAVERQGYRERGAAARSAPAINRAALRLDNRLSDGKAEAPALGFAVGVLRNPIETLEDARELRFRNADAVVRKFNLHKAVRSFQANANGSLRRRVLEGVIEENEEQLPQKGLIALVWQLLLEIARNDDAFLSGVRGGQRAGLLKNLVQV